jgi:hypothetical protein
VTKKLAGGGGCSGWRMAGGVFPTVTRGGGGRLGHSGNVPAYRGSKRLDEGVQELPRGVVVLLERSARGRSCWTSWTHGRRRWSRVGSLCRLLRELQGPPTHGLSLLCSRACAAEAQPACLHSHPQGRRA